MKEDIDYNTKILNFLAMTETNDEASAAKYLEENGWDESRAMNKYLLDLNQNQNNNDLINDNIDQNNILDDTNRSNNDLINENNIESNLNINNIINTNSNKKENFFYKYCIKIPYQFILNCCSDNREISKSDERKIFQLLPNLMDDFIEFCHLIRCTNIKKY